MAFCHFYNVTSFVDLSIKFYTYTLSTPHIISPRKIVLKIVIEYSFGSSPMKKCIIKHSKHTKLYSIEFLRTEMTSDPSNYHREYSPYGSYSLFQIEGSDVISVLKNSIEYSFV